MTSVRDQVDRVSHWRHRIELPGGVVTPGTQDTQAQLAMLHLPAELSGRSVLDIGCSDGFFSFECEKRGAARVLAVDNYSSIIFDSNSGFQVAHQALGSKVEFRQADLFTLDPQEFGRFDLVLFLGVLYHLRHPLLALDRLSELCNDQLILETELSSPRGLWGALKRRVVGADNTNAGMRFHEADDLNRDPTNWWTPTPKCVEGMLRSSGFCGVQTVATHRARGVTHGFSPAHGDDVTTMLRIHGKVGLARVAAAIQGEAVQPETVESVLRSMTIPEFARFRQALAEQSSSWQEEKSSQKAADGA